MAKKLEQTLLFLKSGNHLQLKKKLAPNTCCKHTPDSVNSGNVCLFTFNRRQQVKISSSLSTRTLHLPNQVTEEFVGFMTSDSRLFLPGTTEEETKERQRHVKKNDSQRHSF